MALGMCWWRSRFRITSERRRRASTNEKARKLGAYGLYSFYYSLWLLTLRINHPQEPQALQPEGPRQDLLSHHSHRHTR